MSADGPSKVAGLRAATGGSAAAELVSVAVNDPFKGVELVRKHGRPAENRHSLQIEVKRTLYMDERTLEPHAGYPRLQDDLARLAAILAAFVRDRVRRQTAPLLAFSHS